MDEKKLYIELGARLRSAREKAHLDQAQLASAVGLGRTSITNIEAGRQRPQLHVIYLIAEAIGVGVMDLLPRVVGVDEEAAVREIKGKHGLVQNEIEWITNILARENRGKV